MAPVETLRNVTARYYKQLKREGLNPFDLLSWEALTNLWVMVKRSADRGDFEDRTITKMTKQMLWSALERKAQAIDLEERSDDHEQLLDDLRNL